MSAFPETGLRALMDLSGWTPNVRKYVRDVEQIDRAEGKTAAGSAKLSQATGRLNQVMSGAGKQMGNVKKLVGSLPGPLGNMAGKAVSLGENVAQANEALAGMGVAGYAAAAGVIAAAAGVAAFVALGRRGAAFKGIADGFDVVAQKAGVASNVLLGDLRKAARGMVSDMELMRKANMAFAGVSGPLAKALGDGGLAGLLKVARTQARATGEDVDYFFESLVLGIKRAQPRLIDNTHLQLRTQEANEKYAQSIGKSVEQLTVEERQIALLNATLEAGKEAIDAYGDAHLTAAERQQQIGTTITNLLDRLALVAQPLYELVLAIGQAILDVIIAPLNVLLPILYELGDLVFGTILRAFEAVTGWIKSAFAPLAGVMHKWLVLIVGALRWFKEGLWSLGKSAGQALAPIGNAMKKVVEWIANALDPSTLAYHGAKAFASLARGILNAANKYIFPVIIKIATFIADFLMGQSPPPRGPLRTIDKGGAAVMKAWMGGFTGVSLSPVEQVAGRVNAALGSIAKMSAEQVAARLQAIERYLQPYKDWLNIVKARLENVNALLGVFDRRTKRALKRFLGGEMSAEQMRALDRQTAQARAMADAYQDAADAAEMQLRLAEGRFSVEKVLLGIQQRRTKTQATAAKKAKAAAAKARSSGGSAADAAAAAAGGGGFFAPRAGAEGTLFGISPDEIQKVWGEVSGALAEGFAAGGGADLGAQWALFQSNWSEMKFQGARIGQGFSGLVSKFTNLFGEDGALGPIVKFKDDIVKFFSEDIPNNIQLLVDKVTGWFGVEGTVTGIFDNFSLADFSNVFGDVFGEGGTISGLMSTFSNTISNIFKWKEGGTLYDLITKAGDSVKTSLSGAFKSAAQLMVDALWGGLKAIAGLWNDMIQSLADAAGKIPGVGGDLSGLLSGLTITLGDAPQLFGGSGQGSAGFGGEASYVPRTQYTTAPYTTASGAPIYEATVQQQFFGVVNSDDVYGATREAALSLGAAWP